MQIKKLFFPSSLHFITEFAQTSFMTLTDDFMTYNYSFSIDSGVCLPGKLLNSYIKYYSYNY